MACYQLFVITCLLGVSFSLRSWELPKGNLMDYINQDLDLQWMGFRKTYNKTYQNDYEELKRRLHWEDCLKFIQQHNQKYDLGEVSFVVGENAFCDLAEDEFEEIYLKGLRVPEDDEYPEGSSKPDQESPDVPEAEEYPEGLSEPDMELPGEIDWRQHGYVSSVKNQGECGSCWAFAALGALEGHYAIKYGAIFDLSEQSLIDCSRDYGNYGCRGGFMSAAFKFIKKKGIVGEYCYPYTAKDGLCKLKSNCVNTKIKAFKNVARSEHSLKKKVGILGPVAIGADVNHRSFQMYKKGIYYEPDCSSQFLNHAMLAVGYGTYNVASYWIVKNSWGSDWGDNGYVLMSRNKMNNCGIANMASYPIV